MVRIIAVLVMALVLSACSMNVREGGDPTAEALKTEVDGVAKKVLPPLTEALGVQPTGLQADFTERGGWGIWDYQAAGQFPQVRGTAYALSEKMTHVLTEAGLKVDANSEGLLVGTRGNVMVRLTFNTVPVKGKVPKVNLVGVSIGSAKPTSEGDEFAETAAPEDYLAYVK